MKDFYLFINSLDSFDYFDANKAGHFYVKLNQPICLQERGWHVGLCEINGISWDVEPYDTVYVLTNLSNGLLLATNSEGLLRAISIQNDRSTYNEYAHVLYTPIQTHFIDVIEIQLKVNNFDRELISKTGGSSKNMFKPSTWCVLHFKQLL